MTSITKRLTKYLILLVIMLPNYLWAQQGLLAIGEIDKVGSNYIIITDSSFKTLSTVKVFLLNNKPGRIQDLKKGDLVHLTLLKMGKAKFVDTIRVVPEL